MLQALGLVGTIADGDVGPEEPESGDSEDEEELRRAAGPRRRGPTSGDFSATFVFGEAEAGGEGAWAAALRQLRGKRAATTLDEKIEKVRQRRKLQEREATQEQVRDEDVDTEDNQIKKECGDFSRDKEDTESQYSLDDETIFTKADTVKVKERKRSKKGEMEAKSFFEDASQYDDNLLFQDMNLSRPLLKICFKGGSLYAFHIVITYVFLAPKGVFQWEQVTFAGTPGTAFIMTFFCNDWVCFFPAKLTSPVSPSD